MLLLLLSESSVSRAGVGGQRQLGARCVSGETKSGGRHHHIAQEGSNRGERAVVLNEVIVIVVTHLKGEDEGIYAVRISGEGVEPTHHPGAE